MNLTLVVPASSIHFCGCGL